MKKKKKMQSSYLFRQQNIKKMFKEAKFMSNFYELTKNMKFKEQWVINEVKF